MPLQAECVATQVRGISLVNTDKPIVLPSLPIAGLDTSACSDEDRHMVPFIHIGQFVSAPIAQNDLR